MIYCELFILSYFGNWYEGEEIYSFFKKASHFYQSVGKFNSIVEDYEALTQKQVPSLLITHTWS